jgi:methionyl-tRNA formyltransferase
MVRILFLGTPYIASEVLKHLLTLNYEIVGVVSQPDREKRKGVLLPTPTKQVALKHHIPVFQPLKIRLDYDFVKELKPDLILTLAYGQIIPEELLQIPSLNLHGSLLPLYRGGAPIQRSIMNGDKYTGMSLMKMVKAMDAGEYYYQEKVEITLNDDFNSVVEKLITVSKRILDEQLPLYLEGKLKAIEQDESLVTYARNIQPEEERIDFKQDNRVVFNQIRALSGVGAYTYFNDVLIKIFFVTMLDEEKGEVGQITRLNKKELIIKCLKGSVSVSIIQVTGKHKMNIKDFLNGNKLLKEGDIFK